MEPQNPSVPTPTPLALPVVEAPSIPTETAHEESAATAVPAESAPTKKDDTLTSVSADKIHEVAPEANAASDKPAVITAPIFISKSTSVPEILTSVGFGSLFFVYAAVAFLHPTVLQAAFLGNELGKHIGHAVLAVEISMFINLFLGILLLLGRWKTIVYALAGSWLIIIAAFKVLNLL